VISPCERTSQGPGTPRCTTRSSSHDTPSPGLRIDDLLETARVRTGLEDYGDEWFMEPLEVLVSSLNAESSLERGVELMRGRLVSLLADRLRLRALQAAHPEILEVPVPVLAEICGPWRTRGLRIRGRTRRAHPDAGNGGLR